MTYESNKSVREAAQQAFASLVKVKKVKQRLTDILPTWFLTLFDPSSEVARLGRVLLEETFPPEKFYRLFYKSLLTNSAKHLKQGETGMLEDMVELSKG